MKHCGPVKKKDGMHLSKRNNNTPMSVVAAEESGDGMVTLRCEGENGASATLPMSAEDAAAYPEGANIVLHCVPAEEEAEAAANEEAMYPDNLQGRRAKEEDSIIARTKGYREEA